MGESDRLREKVEGLASVLRDLRAVAVAFSGGVDSSYLLAAALDALGPQAVVALTADSPFLPEREREMAVRVAELLGVMHRLVPFDELQMPEIVSNLPLRCYHCKRARFGALLDLVAAEWPGRVLIHGENAGDRLDYRPGALAAQELGVRAPLVEAGLTKEEIRTLSRMRGLPTWNHPAASCLATRFPYGTPLSLSALRRVDWVEQAVEGVAGITQVRVRDHFPLARLEIPCRELQRVVDEPLRGRLVSAVKAAGYRQVCVDLEGYRMGSMNDGLAIDQPPQ